MAERLRVSVSIVVYRPNLSVLFRVLSTLHRSIAVLNERMPIDAMLYFVDNSCEEKWVGSLKAALQEHFPCAEFARSELITAGDNIGYGRANNLAIKRASTKYHLVMNPDMFLFPDTLMNAIDYMESHLNAGLLVADVQGEDGERHYLCKRNPTLLDMFLRGFAPAFVRRVFANRMAEFEMRNKNYDEEIPEVPYPTGCFMFFRTEKLKEIGGFEPRFFMYLEDADIGRRMLKVVSVVYVPTVKIIHKWARGTHQNWWLKWITIKSAFIYWRKWGGVF